MQPPDANSIFKHRTKRLYLWHRQGNPLVIDKIRWQGHSSFAILGTPFIQIAPWRVVLGGRRPDIILIGHDHHDHCSPADVAKIRSEKTQVIGSENVARAIANTTVIRAWQSINIGRASIKAIPAYSPADPRHPRADNGLGFVISIDYYDIYYAGDSQVIPEMAKLHPDIALLPIDGYGRLSVDEAAQAVQMLKPRWTIPYNWGGSGEEATALDAQNFKSRVGDMAEVVLLPVSP